MSEKTKYPWIGVGRGVPELLVIFISKDEGIILDEPHQHNRSLMPQHLEEYTYRDTGGRGSTIPVIDGYPKLMQYDQRNADKKKIVLFTEKGAGVVLVDTIWNDSHRPAYQSFAPCTDKKIWHPYEH